MSFGYQVLGFGAGGAGENFVTATGPDGDVVEISSGNWPLEGPRYAVLGYDFDF